MKGGFRINRRVGPGRYPLDEVFPDIRACGVLAEIFGGADEIDAAVARTQVSVGDIPHEIFVDNDDGTVSIGLNHLQSAPDEVLYLDIIHELCHVRQHLEGRDLYDRTRAYVDRQTEIEAYEVTVREARRIGLDEAAIRNYLRVSWITPAEHARLLRRLGVHPGA